MWIVTDKGFFSFVVDKHDSNYLWLRARVREDLARNFPDAEIIEKPGADYLFRARVTREHVAKVMTDQIMAADIKGHFKDVAIQRSAKPTHGSRSSAMYAFWTAMAALQPYAPYSKTPRAAEKPFFSSGGKGKGGSWKPGDRTVGTGQTSLPSSGRGSESLGLYGGAGAGRYASDFDWDNRDWAGGDSAPDPVRAPSLADELDADEDQAWWDALSDEERQEYLDEANAYASELDARAEVRAVEVVEVTPDPVNRPGTRRKTRKEKRRERRNRHNQEGTEGRRAERNREGLNGQEAQNRQAYLDRQAAQRAEGTR